MRQGAVCPSCSRNVEIETGAQKNYCMWCGATLYPAAIVDARRRQMLTYLVLLLIIVFLVSYFGGTMPASSPKNMTTFGGSSSVHSENGASPATNRPSPVPKSSAKAAPTPLPRR